MRLLEAPFSISLSAISANKSGSRPTSTTHPPHPPHLTPPHPAHPTPTPPHRPPRRVPVSPAPVAASASTPRAARRRRPRRSSPGFGAHEKRWEFAGPPRVGFARCAVKTPKNCGNLGKSPRKIRGAEKKRTGVKIWEWLEKLSLSVRLPSLIRQEKRIPSVSQKVARTKLRQTCLRALPSFQQSWKLTSGGGAFQADCSLPIPSSKITCYPESKWEDSGPRSQYAATPKVTWKH